MTNDFRDVPIEQIVPAHSMLRPVREEYLEYLELVDSIRAHGLMNSLLVRPHPQRDGVFEIIDGMWRWTACRELNMSVLPCIITLEDLTEAEFLSIQVQANAVSYKTRPIEFAEQMLRMLQLRESAGAPMSLTELAKTVSKSSGWVSTRLKLLGLCDMAKEAIRTDTLPLGKGVALARIYSHEYQLQFLKIAPDMNTRDFELEIGKFISQKRSEKRSKAVEEHHQITLRPRLQSMDTLLIELDRLSNLGQIIVQRGLTTALDGARMALEWVLNLHEEGRQEQVQNIKHRLSAKDRQAILRKRRYEELKELRELAEQREDPYFKNTETKRKETKE